MRLFLIGRGWLDYALVWVACATAVFSIGLSLGSPELAYLFAGGVTLGLAVSLVVSNRLSHSKAIGWDGFLWSGLAFIAAINVVPLNRILPNEGFPFQLLAAGWLCWMILFCSFVSWRDQSMLFLTLPCIALFGLVGTFEQYAFGTVMFFAFLVSAAVLYARVHHRGMIERAKLAGVEDTNLLSRDSWRWMAGPEWAVGSAFVVVLVSLLSAPLLRMSVQNVAGRIRVELPQPGRSPATMPNVSTEQYVGRGPNQLDATPTFEVRTDAGPYLRTAAYPLFTGRGWSRLMRLSGATSRALRGKFSADGGLATGPHGGIVPFPGGAPMEEITDPRFVKVEIRRNIVGFNGFATPGPIFEVVRPKDVDLVFNASGSVSTGAQYGIVSESEFYAALPAAGARATSAGLSAAMTGASERVRDPGPVTPRMYEFVIEATKGGQDDHEKMLMLQRAVTNAVKYNLSADAIPADKNLVDTFLFETKEGYCDLFATSMAVGARILGLPSRYVVGYLVDPGAEVSDGFKVVRRMDYHAWAEVHFRGVGWVSFDATEGAIDISPNDGSGEIGDGIAWYQRPWVLWVVGGVLITGVGYAIAASVRRSGPRATSAQRRVVLAIADQRFQRAIERTTGKPRRYSETIGDYVSSVTAGLGSTASEARALAAELDKAFFGVPGRDDTGDAELAKRVEVFRRVLKGEPRVKT